MLVCTSRAASIYATVFVLLLAGSLRRRLILFETRSNLSNPSGLSCCRSRYGDHIKGGSIHDARPKSKTYNRRDSQMVTHSSTSRPVQCLCMAEQTGCPVLTDLWSHVLTKLYPILIIIIVRATSVPCSLDLLGMLQGKVVA